MTNCVVLEVRRLIGHEATRFTITMNTGTHKGSYVIHEGRHIKLGPDGAFGDVVTTVTGRGSVCNDAQAQLQVSSVLRNRDGAARVGPEAFRVDE